MTTNVRRVDPRWLTLTVLGIGLASLFSDLSHEAVTAVLPALLASMGVAAGALGTIEGVADGLSSVAKLYGGWWTDRLHRRKPLCAFGYGAMAIATGVIADRKLLLGRDESLTFKIVEGQIDQKVSDFLRERITRPFVTSFVEEEAAPLAEIPVKHSHRFGGCEGVLKVYSDRLVYESQTGHDSRSWRWTDIRSVGRSDIYRFEVETFEHQIGASSRSFNFILKERMPDKTYDLMWSRVFRPTPLIRAEVKPRER